MLLSWRKGRCYTLYLQKQKRVCSPFPISLNEFSQCRWGENAQISDIKICRFGMYVRIMQCIWIFKIMFTARVHSVWCIAIKIVSILVPMYVQKIYTLICYWNNYTISLCIYYIVPTAFLFLHMHFSLSLMRELSH